MTAKEGRPGNWTPLPHESESMMSTLELGQASDAATEKIVGWVLSRPVLTLHLRQIVTDEMAWLGGEQELICTVVDMLNPDRSPLWRDVLRATGARIEDADSLWGELGGDSGWMNRVCWSRVRQALLDLNGERDAT